MAETNSNPPTEAVSPSGINWLENLPSEGPEALIDRTDTPSFGRKEPAAAPAE